MLQPGRGDGGGADEQAGGGDPEGRVLNERTEQARPHGHRAQLFLVHRADAHVGEKKLCVQRIWVVIVDFCPLFRSHVRKVAVVIVK